MKLSAVLKIILKCLDNVSESGFVLQFCETTINLAPVGVLCILGNQYLIGGNLSSSVMFSLFKLFTIAHICLNYFFDGMRSLKMCFRF